MIMQPIDEAQQARDERLILAVTKKSLAAIDQALAEGANVNIHYNARETHADFSIKPAGTEIFTPLHRVMLSAYTHSGIKKLLEAGANINARSASGDTPLHTAALWNNVYAVKNATCRWG